jgi:ADP-heptose:LPS heptosyltransferase
MHFQLLSALPEGQRHEVELYKDQARSLDALRLSGFPAIPCPAVQRSFAVLHPFASSVAKRAPITAFYKMAERLSDRMPVQWLCGPEEELENAVRIPDLFDLACWLRGARIFVGNDSGISHLAAAVGTPVVALFRTTPPRVWAPRGPSVLITGALAEDASGPSPLHSGEVHSTR